jgi:hypothetical protein
MPIVHTQPLTHPPNEWDAFLIKESIVCSLHSEFRAVQTRHSQAHQRATDRIGLLITKFKTALETTVHENFEHVYNSQYISKTMQNLHRRGAEFQREAAALHITYHRKMCQICQTRITQIHQNLQRTIAFFHFLHDLVERFLIVPMVDTDAFERSLESTDIALKKMEQMKVCLREISERSSGTGDWDFNLLHPDSDSGKIIGKTMERVAEVTYDELIPIIDRLDATGTDFKRVEDVCFDVAWTKTPFPFGNRRESHVKLSAFGELFPAALDIAVVGEEYGFVPFSRLNGMKWAFKSTVDMLFEMMILTNPFDIARVYWNVLQDTTSNLQKVAAEEGTEKTVEIAMDELFPALLVCVFVFGVDEWGGHCPVYSRVRPTRRR